MDCSANPASMGDTSIGSDRSTGAVVGGSVDKRGDLDFGMPSAWMFAHSFLNTSPCRL